MIPKMKCHDKINLLKSLKENLKISDRSFAVDLLTKHAVYGLSESQIKWVDILIERAQKGYVVAEQPKIDVGNFSGVIKLFAEAKKHLPYPKIVLSCGGKSIIFSVSGKASKQPGWINLTGEGQYPNRPYYGKVSPEGQWLPAKMDESMQFALQDLLVEFSIDPAKIAKENGSLTGNCCFCNAKLTDKRSTAAGFGPICSKHWGLEDQWKNAVKMAEEKEINVTPGGDKFMYHMTVAQHYKQVVEQASKEAQETGKPVIVANQDNSFAGKMLEYYNGKNVSVAHIYGDVTNDDPANLQVVTAKENLPHYENEKWQKFYFPKNLKDAKITFLPIEEVQYYTPSFKPVGVEFYCAVCGKSGSVAMFENVPVCLACKAELVAV